MMHGVDTVKLHFDWLICEKNGGGDGAASLGEVLAVLVPGDSVGEATTHMIPTKAGVELFGGSSGGGYNNAAPVKNFPSKTVHRAVLHPNQGANVLLTARPSPTLSC